MYNDYVQISNRPYRAENLSILWEKQPQRGEIYVEKHRNQNKPRRGGIYKRYDLRSKHLFAEVPVPRRPHQRQ